MVKWLKSIKRPQRANTLRLALTGQLDLNGISDPAVMEALDLCLECKACKSECPTNVDMARLKAEVLHQHHQKHGLPWRSWLFGNVASVSKWGCRLAPMSNWLAGGRLGRWLNDRLLGIDQRRKPPAFARQPFLSMVRELNVGAPSLPPVVLFPDTFMNFHEPELGRAALELLRRTNRVVIPQKPMLRCCGRPMISNGMLGEAVVAARHNVEQLSAGVCQSAPIIACEPSCILTIKDDYPALLQGDLRHKAQEVASRCYTFEEYLESRWTGGEGTMLPSPFGRGVGVEGTPRKILVQSHCHQRSLVGTAALLRLLRRIPGAQVVDLDAGCCGMAGSFGYEKEHYEISRRVGEQRLFPALRQEEAATVIVAPGFSCRLQIEHFTGQRALHPALLLARLSTREFVN